MTTTELETMTVKQLKALAKERGLKIGKGTKANLVTVNLD